MGASLRSLRCFFLGNYLVISLMLVGTIGERFLLGPGAFLFSVAITLGYAMLFLAPTVTIALLMASRFPRGARVVAVTLASLTVLALYGDLRIHALYGFHFNGFIWNLLTTPGGLESLGGSSGTLAALAGLCVLVVALEAAGLGLAALLVRRGVHLPRRRLRFAVAAVLAGLVSAQLAYGYGRILAWQPVLLTAREIPLFIPTRVQSLAALTGIKPTRASHGDIPGPGALRYPLRPLQVAQDARSPNIIWLVSESLRADMLTPEIMPNLWRFAADSHRFTNHYSGGNGTHMGVFSMFYGLPGSYWFPFLQARRQCLFVDELQRRNYQFGLYTSSRFTYPEFDKTVFARVPTQQLHSDGEGASWQADRRNVARLLDFIGGARQQPERPWFAFMFFNSPHARYYFPEESVIRPDYLADFNYAREDADAIGRDIDLIRNRYINSVHHLDQQLGRVFDYVAANHLKKDTVIVVTGDHGEEFMDQGRWGHNSELHNAQVHTPLVLWLPGEGGGVHDWPTSHLDLVATLLPRMGVSSPVGDYAEGRDLFKPDAERYRLVSSWEALAYVDPHYKVSLPMDASGLGQTRVSGVGDEPVADPGRVLARLQPRTLQVLGDLSRFYRKN